MSNAYPFSTVHSASASGTFYDTAWRAVTDFFSGLEFNGFPTGGGQPWTGHLAFSGGGWYGYNGANWVPLGQVGGYAVAKVQGY